jgi:gamma-glutamylputrescine oxidase
MPTAEPAHVESYYAASVGPLIERPSLSGERSCEVCVIGGGLTGVSAALNLAEEGIDVVLLEAHRIGWGASGRNGGQAQTGFGGEIEDLEPLVGLEAARALWDITVDGLGIIEDRCARHNIACDLKHGYLLAAAKARTMDAHVMWVERAARAYGYDRFRLLDRDAVRVEVATESYHGGILDKGSMHLHPLKYCLGLADAAAAAGAELFENSRVVRVEPGARPTVVTERGTVRADRLVIACNAFLAPLAGGHATRIMPVGTYICATEPLGEDRARALLPNDISVCDDRHVLDYFRLSADRRILFGGRETFALATPEALARSTRRRMLRVFPQLADVRIDHVWGGEIALTRNRFPDIGRAMPNIYYAQGFSGHGLALSGIAGKVIAEAIAGDPAGLDLFGSIPHRPFPGGAALRAPLMRLGLLWYGLRDLV